MDSKNNRFEEAFMSVIKDYGEDTLYNIDRLNALLMDYAPQDAKDRRLLCTILRQGIGIELKASKNSPQEVQLECINKCKYRLKNDTWLSDDAASYGITVLCKAFGIDVVAFSDETVPVQHEKQKTRLLKGVIPATEASIEQMLAAYNEIGYKAFAANTAITNVTIPNSIHAVFSKSFCDCTQLKAIHFPQDINSIAPGAFKGCLSLEEISIDSGKRYVVVNGLLIDKTEKMLIRAANSKQQKIISIPEQVISIAPYAFDHCTAETIKLPARLKMLSDRAFWQCAKLQRIETGLKCADFYATSDGVLHNQSKTVLIKFPAGSPVKNYYLEDEVKTIAPGAFKDAQLLESLTFTNALSYIGSKAFEGCIRLSSLIIPSNVRTIGERAFQYCTSLTHVMLPRGIDEIGDYAFNGCESIQQINIPQSVTRIGHGAFHGCKKLKKVVIQDGVTFIGDGAFADCPSDLEISVKSNPYVETYCKSRSLVIRKA